MAESEEEIAALKARLAELEGGSRATSKPGARAGAIGCGAMLVVAAVAVFAVSRCSSDGAKAPPAASAAIPATPPAPEAAAEPVHIWQYREGREYGYASEISTDAKNSGTAAPEVHMYRFLGEKNGVYTVATVMGGVIFRASCTKPCDVIKVTGGGFTQRVAYSPESIAGAALTDAMNGQMELWRPASAPADPQQ